MRLLNSPTNRAKANDDVRDLIVAIVLTKKKHLSSLGSLHKRQHGNQSQ